MEGHNIQVVHEAKQNYTGPRSGCALKASAMWKYVLLSMDGPRR